MLSEKTFIETIELIKTKRSHEEALCNALEQCSGEHVFSFIYSDYENQVLKLLNEGMNIPEDDDIIAWWIYDLDFGDNYKEGCITDHDKNVMLKTAHDLYKYCLTIGGK